MHLNGEITAVAADTVPPSRCGHLQNEELATPWLKLRQLR